jgi:DNA polymerase III subunit alpha
MADLVVIKQELTEAVKQQFHRLKEDHSVILDRVTEELNSMAEVEGLDGAPVLEKFHAIWKSTSGTKHGQENKVNSWTAYYLGMTNKKPSGDFLPVRRAFARKGFPDIDSDFDYEYRGEIYDYIIEKYGRQNVGNIGTYQALKLKSYIRRAFKAIDPDHLYADTKEGKERWKKEANERADEITKSLPPQIGAILKVEDEEGVEHAIKTVADGVKYCEDFRRYIHKYPAIAEHSGYIQGLLSSYGVHPAGIVISSIPLEQIAPLRTSKIKSGIDEEGETKYAFATQYANEDLEFMGLIKFDILALSTLSVIARTKQLVRENYDIELDIENLPLEDRRTFDLYRSGKLLGVFQCEKPGMQRTMVNIGVDRFEDIIAGVALFRPGPMESIPAYAARKKGEQRVDYFHPTIEPFTKPYLESTYGVLCYQEQVMQICNSLAGFSIGDGYAVIKAVGKKVESLLAKYRSSFVKGCMVNGVPEKVATDYWDKFITPFANYGFNKSHSACYGYMSYITAYLKAHFPEEFMVSHLNVFLASKKQDKYEKIAEYEKEIERMGIDFLPRSINKCGFDYSIATKKDKSKGIFKSQLRPSLRCKGLSVKAAQEIITQQPYEDLRSVAFKTDKVVDKTSIESLCIAGFFRDKNGKKLKVEEISEQFSGLREDRKRSERKGVESDDMFDE